MTTDRGALRFAGRGAPERRPFLEESLMARAAALLLVFLVAAGPVRAQLSGAAIVTDGDTLKVGAERVRLHRFDAPESTQTCLRRFVRS